MLGDNLPMDLMKEVMVRLPVKSLLRFKCVAKSWYALITDHYFITKHFEWSNSKGKNRLHRLVFERFGRKDKPPSISLISNRDQPYEIQNLELPCDKNNLRHMFVYGQCNGIFCLSGDYEDVRRLILWNPATKEVKVIPTSQWQPKGPYWADYGFGFDSMTKDYKIVQFPKEEEGEGEEGEEEGEKEGDLLVQMYNLSTDSWKKLDVDVSIYKNPHSPMGPYLYGAYHWFACSHDDIGKFIVMRFDFSKEAFGILQSPPGITSSHEEDNDVLGIVDESLSWAAARRVSIEVCIQIWVMNKYGVESSWTKKFEIRPSPHSFFWSVVEFWGDDEIIVFDDDITHKLFSCNFRNQRTERLNYDFPMMMDYVESFFPIGGSENTKI